MSISSSTIARSLLLLSVSWITVFTQLHRCAKFGKDAPRSIGFEFRFCEQNSITMYKVGQIARKKQNAHLEHLAREAEHRANQAREDYFQERYRSVANEVQAFSDCLD
ncbi:hypothetical protein [Synechococcus sp. MIT S9451]|uniref:hypothetical protein n=1 Tax=Synechococcus sp. MIT S9451 TaxID=3082543 RepID=UPI0039B4CC29